MGSNNTWIEFQTNYEWYEIYTNVIQYTKQKKLNLSTKEKII